MPLARPVVLLLILLRAGAAVSIAGTATAERSKKAFLHPYAQDSQPAEGQQEVPTVTHIKTAGEGYKEGSPLYDKQQALQEEPSKSIPVSRFLEYAIGAITDIILVVVVAYLYKTYSAGNLEQPTEKAAETWAYSLFGCFSDIGQDWKLLLMSCCCGSIRWADTVSNMNVKVFAFWPALALVLFFAVVLGPITGGLSCLVLLGIAIYSRQKIRTAYGFETGGVTYVADCLSYFFCGCCALVQEARQVERVVPVNAVK